MKKAVAFLLAFLIFITPMTTLVKADVVIGDNEEIIINENATILGRKLALMESLSDLALSGVTDFTISNTNDVDSYLDFLWTEIDDAIDYLDSGQWTNDLSNDLASKYFTNLVQYKDYINNRGDYLAHFLPSGNPTTSLLSTFFANNIFGKVSTEHYNLSLNTFRALSRINTDSYLPTEYDWVKYVGTYAMGQDKINFSTMPFYSTTYSKSIDPVSGYQYMSYYTSDNFNSDIYNNTITMYSEYLTNIYINHIGNRFYVDTSEFGSDYTQNSYFKIYGVRWCNNFYDFRYSTSLNEFISNSYGESQIMVSNTDYETLDGALNYVFAHFRHINLYVDNTLWVNADDSTSSKPTLDIDGFLKIFGNNNPTQYELQPNTKIDYDELYQVIYNAIRDNLPISQGDINYYDSHDTIYSPTIINNYGEEDGDESDLIDTILDYAVIPKFDTAIAQPMRQALTNGVVIMNNSITNVIPNEILLILGACFFLLLFAVVINRMIK